jgi:NAD(P)H-nitrite reductase large subunit
MAVSGCHLSCSESWVRDIGLIGFKDVWQAVIGGNVGADPRIAQAVASGFDDDGTLKAVEKIIQCYQVSAKKGERLGKTIEWIGLEPFKAALS